MAAKMAFVPLALSRLRDSDVSGYFVLLSAVGYVGLIDAGILPAAHARLAQILASDGNTAAFEHIVRVQRTLWRSVIWTVATLLVILAIVRLFWRECAPSAMAVCVTLAIAAIAVPFRAAVPLSYALRAEHRLTVFECAGQLLPLFVVLAMPLAGFKVVGPTVIIAVSMLCQTIAYGLLLRDLEGVLTTSGSSSISNARSFDGRADQISLFGCAVLESVLLYIDPVAVALIGATSLAGPIGLGTNIWLQCMAVTNIFLIRVWTISAEFPDIPMRAIWHKLGDLRFGIISLTVLTTMMLGLSMPLLSGIWTQHRITFSNSEGWSLAAYYAVAVLCTANSFRMKGCGAGRARMAVLGFVVATRAVFVLIVLAVGASRLSLSKWFIYLSIMTLLCDLVPSVWLHHRRVPIFPRGTEFAAR